MIVLTAPVSDLRWLRFEIGNDEPSVSAEFEFASSPIHLEDTPDEASNDPVANLFSNVSLNLLEEAYQPETPTAIDRAGYGDVKRMAKLTAGKPRATRLSSTASLSATFDGRSAENKTLLLNRYGGSQQSEAAVALALRWLIEHQVADGGWTFAHDEVCLGKCGDPGRFASSRNGATGLALLPFLGAGETHMAGQYKDVIDRGLTFLIAHQYLSSGSNPTGAWHEQGGTMYSHCLATIAICEAYAMTGDSRLRDPAQRGLDYLVKTQDPRGGGWRYAPQQPGDTSVVGWAIMALKSGKIGGLTVPDPTLTGTEQFLNSVSSAGGGKYGYLNQKLMHDGGVTTTSIGVLCRMYQGLPRENRGINRGVSFISSTGPRLDNLYYSYYATQVMRHLGGPEWEPWNRVMRDSLVQSQLTAGHASGSWMPNPLPEMGGMMGGRLYSTCLATMILEVYYRHMPLYTDKSIDDEFAL
ncbi:prenyltransferase/squalene oxidase repeat-containing protein [Aporhodopirellula aestuarii]|uniref:Terpene cyclase/mutase family protein n=1 Tax=Aporhodopirellula aestuarii TaxID=2950107 RepID=A0ABT0UC64_9BACT|nr:prenyltransferase/squalene oxidase repeat-containing protein [Aporhodopirellula aestuarii]MCM2374614.1 terpene cyclase/mutase family protein [Aporhodopirellula aestuarii]